MTKIAIVGGGAAGMMVAASLLEREDREGEILLFEKNKQLGAKVLISGGGRCNLTTGIIKRKELQSYYTRGREFLEFSMRKFGPRAVRKWFESYGVSCKEEEDHRVFPVSDRGEDVVGVFEKIFENERIDIHFSEGVKDITGGLSTTLRQKAQGDKIKAQGNKIKAQGNKIKSQDNKIKSQDNKIDDGEKRFIITTEKGEYHVDKVVITTGGNAFAHTGSSGDGYAFARALGHTITPLGPSLNSFITREKWTHDLSGLSFPDAVLRVSLQDRRCRDAFGAVLLTHFGISGPATFKMASYTAFEDLGQKPLFLFFQPLASVGIEEWENFLLLSSHEHPKKKLSTILSEKLPKRFATAFIKSYFKEYIVIGHLTKNMRKRISGLLGHGISLICIKRRSGDEFVTAGGVDTSAINPKTLESTICPGLYFAGEVVNVDGVTGGFNLQACWAMGRAVGNSVK